MSVRIRLRRMGAKKRPFYRVVVADQRTARDGRFIEQLGYYDPTTNPPTMKVDEEKARLWLSRGAQPSDVARSLLTKLGVISGGKAKAKAEVEAEAAPAQEEAAPPKRTRRKSTAKAKEPVPEVEEPTAQAEPPLEAAEEPQAEAEADPAPAEEKPEETSG
ncbi:MAG: 30S ribosomal protein S16 [Armatimonadetes bacterium]|nr:30S ribosomal protein S16 [Armatimonadota bacterium]